MWYCYIVIGVLSTLVLFYWIVEFHYFLRMAVTAFAARFVKKKTHIMSTTQLTGVCLITDVDTLLYHMNNARYIRELDFARVDFYQRTRLYQRILKKGGGVVQGACTIRYRRFIPTFTVYYITSRVVYWDASFIYMEHRFITPKDGFVRAIAVCKQRVIGINVEELMVELLQESITKADPEATIGVQPPNTKPEMPLEVLRWDESNQISSANLRNGC